MRNHFFKRQICPAVQTDIEMTDEIKEYILVNKKYRLQKILKNKKVCKHTNIEANASTNIEANARTNIEANASTNIEANARTNIEATAATNIEANAETIIEANARTPNELTSAEIKNEGYIYILQEREFVYKGEGIYKIGRTCQLDPMKRINYYPKGSLIKTILFVPDCVIFEGKIKKLFRTKYTQMNDIGTEYFKGSLLNMIKDFANLVLESLSNS
jgi:hypothetical protein